MGCDVVIHPPPSIYHKAGNGALRDQWAIKYDCQNDSFTIAFTVRDLVHWNYVISQNIPRVCKSWKSLSIYVFAAYIFLFTRHSVHWSKLPVKLNSNSKRIYLTKSTSMSQQDIINIQKMTLIVGRLLLWYKMYRFRESHPVNTNRQCHNCHSVYPLPWLEHWKANFEFILFSLSSGWFRRIEYEEHWSFFDRRATRTILLSYLARLGPMI